MTQDEKPTEPEEKEPIKVAFSVPQIAGGALAAVTAATIGSQLGVAGTIVGAAVASIIGGVAGTLYSAGIDRTHRKVSAAINRGYERVRNEPGYDRDAARGPGGETEQMLPGLVDPTRASGSEAAAASGAATEPTEPSSDGRRRVWKIMGLTAAAMFVLALVAITFVELGLGRALDGQGGTTISQVVQPTRTPTPTPSRTPSATATPSVTPTPSVTITPSVTPTPAMTPTPTVVEPTPSTLPTPSVTESPVPTDGSTP